MLFPGEGKPSPGPPPWSAARRTNPRSVPVSQLCAQRSWVGGPGGGAPSPPGIEKFRLRCSFLRSAARRTNPRWGCRNLNFSLPGPASRCCAARRPCSTLPSTVMSRLAWDSRGALPIARCSSCSAAVRWTPFSPRKPPSPPTWTRNHMCSSVRVASAPASSPIRAAPKTAHPRVGRHPPPT